MTKPITTPDTSATEIKRIFDLQREHQFVVGNTTAKERIRKLKRLNEAVMKYRPRIKEALYDDYRKHPSEVDMTEIYPVVSEIRHAKRKLRTWMDKQRVTTPLALVGSSSYVRYEPKGVTLLISPWNFPINLTLGPLVSAIAAGNTVIIKPSEMTPNASALLRELIEEVFEENEVALVEGAVATAKDLLELPFNHIFFTGAPSIGKIVMGAAAKHLTSVTLELGGKSPTIVDETADIKTAARRVAWGKYSNNGQICIAPDYVYVHESKKTEFLAALKETLNDFYAADAAESTSYARIVNHHHYDRVKGYVEDAVSKGATVEAGGTFDGDQDYISPTVITGAPLDSDLMTEEIFGPVLPVFGYTDLEDVLKMVNGREKPLALYIFSKSNRNIKHILANTRAGGTCINHNAVHFYNTHLPFGGSNNSGIGKGHGWYGFTAFSNARAVFRQHIPNALELLVPPYTGFKQKIIDLTVKYF